MAGFMGSGPGMGGFMGGPGMSGNPGETQLPPEDSQIQWLYVYLEVKNFRGAHTKTGDQLAWVEHKWSDKGKWSAIFGPKNSLVLERFEARPLQKDFDDQIKKELKVTKSKHLTPKSMLIFARRALQYNLTKSFHDLMGDLSKEVARLDPNDTAAKDIGSIVKNYQRVQQALRNKPAGDDPAFRNFRDSELVKEKFVERTSDGGHYSLWISSSFKPSPEVETLVKQKLARLEEHFETFYYWFAMVDGAEQPAMPKYRLTAVMTNANGYADRVANWGVQGPVGDGFTPRRDNVLFLSSERQDSIYSVLNNTYIKPILHEKFKQLTASNIPTADLLSGKIWDEKKLPVQMHSQVIVEAQTLLLLQKAFEEEAERQTITYEGTRQLLVASGMFPRHVNVPEWVLSGIASYFETPEQSVFGGVGLPSWTNLISFKHFQKEVTKDKHPNRLTKPEEVLYNTLTDRYFDIARASSELSQEKPNDEKLADKAREDWEFARCTAWGYVYHLVNSGRINELFRYGEELNKLPRDMDLSEPVLQACAARAFNLSHPTNASRISMAKVGEDARAWYKRMDDTTLEMVAVQQFHLTQRELLSRPKAPPPETKKGPGGFPGPGGNPIP
jgi:hypothetical protein